jgi:hypothetical protein
MANGESLLKGDQKRIADRNAMRTGKKAQLDKKFGKSVTALLEER